MCYEINAEPDEVIYMCACLLLDPFQLYLEMSVVFVLSIYSHCPQLHCWEWKCVVGIFLGGGGVGEILIRR